MSISPAYLCLNMFLYLCGWSTSTTNLFPHSDAAVRSLSHSLTLYVRHTCNNCKSNSREYTSRLPARFNSWLWSQNKRNVDAVLSAAREELSLHCNLDSNYPGIYSLMHNFSQPAATNPLVIPHKKKQKNKKKKKKQLRCVIKAVNWGRHA